MEWSAYLTSAALICGLFFILMRVIQGSKFGFLFWMIALLIVSNIAFIAYIAVYDDRRSVLSNTASTRADKLDIVSFSIACDFIRYACWQVMIWLFSFKYWVVSVEMPKAIRTMTRRSQSRSGSKISRTISVQTYQTDDEIVMENFEKQYQWVKWAGVIVNLVFVTWYCIEYGKECMSTE